MLTVYPACFFKEECSYSVIFPDLNHLTTCGEILDEAMKMAVDCLAGYIRWCRRDGDIIPDLSPMEQIDPEAVAKDVDPDSPLGEAFVNLVSVDVKLTQQNTLTNLAGKPSPSRHGSTLLPWK